MLDDPEPRPGRRPRARRPGRSPNQFAAPSDEDLFLDVTNPRVIEWVAKVTLAPPPPPDPLAPAGTDLVGVLWAHDDTPTGASTHGLFCAIPPGPTDVCSIADAYSVVAPDPVALRAPGDGSAELRVL